MDRRTLLAIGLSFLIFLGWQKFYIEPRTQRPQQQVTQQAAPQAVTPVPTGMPKQETTEQQTKQAVAPAPTTAGREETKAVKLSTGTAFLSSGNQILSGWTLEGFKEGTKATAAQITLGGATNVEKQGELAFDSGQYAYLSQVNGRFEFKGNQVTWIYEDDNVKLTRSATIDENQPFIDMIMKAEFKAAPPKYAFVSLASQGQKDDPEAQDRNLVHWSNNSIEWTKVDDSIKLAEAGGTKWVGATTRYFVLSLIDRGQVELPKSLVQPLGVNHGRASLVYPMSGNTVSIPLRVFFGPKKLDVLRSVEPTLDHTVDFGWFTVIAYPLLKVMNWFYSIFKNYGLSIILLTLLVKIATYPLTYKSMKSMKEMAKLQPQLQKLREKHKDNKEALNKEMLTMMKSHGYNPMAGCWPIMIQMPVFFALYRVLYSAIELYHAPFAFWIQDLSAKDPYYVTPVLLTVVMYVQQKMTPNTATDPTQAKMMQFMPVIFGVFMLTLPSGLTVYMLVNAIVSILQQIIMNKKLDGRNVPALATRAK